MARFIIEVELDDSDMPGQLTAPIVQNAFHTMLSGQDAYAINYLWRRYRGLDVETTRIEQTVPQTKLQQVMGHLSEEEASDILAVIQEYNNEVNSSLSLDYVLEAIANEVAHFGYQNHQRLCDIVAIAIVAIDRLPAE